MKILVISNMYPSDKDHVYGVFVKNFYDYIKNYNKEGRTQIIAIRGKDYGIINALWKYFIFYIEIIWNCLLHKYDIIYVHTITYPTPPLRLVSLFKRLPLIFNIHGSDLITHSKLTSKLKEMSYPMLIQAKMIVVPSTVFRKTLITTFPAIEEDVIYVSPSGGVDTDVFIPMNNNCAKVLILGYVSHIEPLKGWRLFVEAIEKLVSKGYAVKGIMVGNGIEESELREMLRTKANQIDIDYLGAVYQKDLPIVYNQMDLFLFPTLYFESLGLVGLEAMACGVPVVASNAGGPTEYVKDGKNGFLFERGSVDDLVDKIERFIVMSDDEKGQMTSNARKTAMNYDKKRIMNKLFHTFTRTI